MEMIFSCDKCGQQMTIDSQYAGMSTNCINCQAEVIIPEAPQEPEDLPPAEDPIPLQQQQQSPPQHTPPQRQEEPPAGGHKHCPKCRNELFSDQAIICTNCGYNLKSGMNVKTAAVLKKSGKAGLAVLAGAGAAIISGVIWGGIAIATEWEFGYVAVLVGFITGGTIRLLTYERSTRMGLAAVFLAILGLLIGKMIMAEHAIRQVEKEFTSIATDKDTFSDEELIMYLTDEMIEKGEITNPVAEPLALGKTGIKADDPKYIAALDKMDRLTEENEANVKKRFESLTEDELKKLREKRLEVVNIGLLMIKMAQSGELSDDEEEELEEQLADIDDPKNPAYRKAMLEMEVAQKANFNKAKTKYRSMPEAEREKMISEVKASYGSIFRWVARVVGFLLSFGLFDIVFFIIAIIGAWQMATRATAS